jgi:hypothetical protein
LFDEMLNRMQNQLSEQDAAFEKNRRQQAIGASDHAIDASFKRLDAMLYKQAVALENKSEGRCEEVGCYQQDGPGSRSPSPVRKQSDTGADETIISNESTDQADTDDTLVYDKSGDPTVLVKDASELEGVTGKEDEVMGEVEMDNLTGVICLHVC